MSDFTAGTAHRALGVDVWSWIGVSSLFAYLPNSLSRHLSHQRYRERQTTIMTTSTLFRTFTPPPECLSNTYRYGHNQLVGPMTSTCYPSGWTNASTTYYSPGVCPSGYTTACITGNTAGSVTETVATCCPS